MSIATDEAPIHDDPIPMYAQLDIWSALHSPEDVDPAEYDAFRAEHGFADTWAELCAAVRTVARGAGYITVRTAEPTEGEIESAARVFFGNLHYPSASLDWDKASDHVKDNWRLKTRLALTAARKAVTA
ncbi:hypothetical protein BPY_23090 [Bifidobacterium psychraerophilum]|uniref:hypothetical protein n=1 Tax=Bifidobacterium psychraerophilum TaxID=218140 RepID=UPI003114E63F